MSRILIINLLLLFIINNIITLVVNKLLVVLFIHCNNTCNCNNFMLPDQLEKAFDPNEFVRN